MPFCCQSRPLLDFSCPHLGCVDLCKVTLLCLWILSSILSVRQETNLGLLASNKSLPLIVLLIFFASSVVSYGSVIVWGVSLAWVVLNQCGHPFGYVCSL